MPKSKLEQEVEAEIDRYVNSWGEELRQHFNKTPTDRDKTADSNSPPVTPTRSPKGD